MTSPTPREPSSMRLHHALVRRALGVVIVLLTCLLAPALAHATVGITADEIERTERSSTLTQYRYYVSRADCESTDTWTIPYQISDYAGKTLEVWIGENADCRDFAARDPATTTQARCTKVAESGDPGGPSNNGNYEITVTSSAIANALVNVESCIDSSSNTSPRSISVFLLLLNAATDDVDDANSLQFDDARVDLLGPNPPSGVSASPGDSSARVSYDIAGSVDDVKGYVVYCEPAGAVSQTSSASSGASGTSGAGTSGSSSSSGTSTASGMGGGGGMGGMGGMGGGGGGMMGVGSGVGVGSSSSAGSSSVGTSSGTGTSSSSGTGSSSTSGGGANASCPAANVVAGGLPPSAFRCSEESAGAAAIATLINGVPLENGTNYAVAVAATDDLGNVGVLSSVVCVTPEQSDDFFETYCKERGDNCVDGPGGCALCAVGAPQETDRTPLLGLALALAAAIARKAGKAGRR